MTKIVAVVGEAICESACVVPIDIVIAHLMASGDALPDENGDIL